MRIIRATESISVILSYIKLRVRNGVVRLRVPGYRTDALCCGDEWGALGCLLLDNSEIYLKVQKSGIVQVYLHKCLEYSVKAMKRLLLLLKIVLKTITPDVGPVWSLEGWLQKPTRLPSNQHMVITSNKAEPAFIRKHNKSLLIFHRAVA
ncbi:hypothetical protein TNCV_2450771 [Trichonephila clavipes]|nr:hypothetical protein TNCV_2450771 [Trichonephila clavipes]